MSPDLLSSKLSLESLQLSGCYVTIYPRARVCGVMVAMQSVRAPVWV